MTFGVCENCRVRTNEQGENHAFPIPPRWRVFLPLYWIYWATLGRAALARRALDNAKERLAALEADAQPLGPTGVHTACYSSKALRDLSGSLTTAACGTTAAARLAARAARPMPAEMFSECT